MQNMLQYENIRTAVAIWTARGSGAVRLIAEEKMAKHIILVDDDALLRRSLTFNLEKEGYRVSAAGSAEDALELVRRDPADLILLDILLPGMDGLAALREFRAVLNAPIIFLTTRRRGLDEALGLELGADDYVTKPFDFEVLLARIRAAMRRVQPAGSIAEKPEVLTAGDIVLDPGAHVVTIADRTVDLSPREFELLHALVLNAGRVVPADELLRTVWGAEFDGEPQVVYVHIRWLREKIENDPQHPERVVTVRGVGYKLEPREGQ